MRWGRPFDPKAEAIWVRGTLVGRQGREQQFLLLVDTGTPETIVDDELAAQIGLDRSQEIGPAHFRGFTGPQKGYYVMADQLQVFGRTVAPFRVACCPCDPEFEIDGLLGLDFLRDTVVTLDFKQGRILLED
ncbi:MAG: retroviral-like aspartic protease family protein [Candidatus Riflebacteria bacterium]|nr:retroviral-like aspartic protease family protein [Candidatus Riflebacteria bacterium]